MIKTFVNMVFFARDCTQKLFVNISMSGINATITNHLVVLFRDMLNEAFNKIHYRNRFFYVCIILMTIIVKSDKVTIIFIDSGSGNNRTTEITTDVFYDNIWVTFVRFCINIETLLMITITGSLNFFKRRS